MKQSHESRNLPETPRNQSRTPRRPSPPGLPTTATKIITARNRSLQSSTSASTRKRTSLPRVQSTLTQIDFVTQPTPSNDDQLGYIDEHKRRDDTRDTTQRPNVDDRSDKDSDYLPAPSVRSARISKFKMNERERDSDERSQKRRSSGIVNRDASRSHGPRKSETPRASVRPRGGRKSLEKSTGKRDKTLTQMDFVRRYITIDDDDDDVNMSYIQPTPQKKDIKDEQTEHTPKQKQLQPTKRPTSAKRKRRAFEEELDLSTGEPISQQKEAPESNLGSGGEGERVSAAPVTPQKLRTREIPSSQTPESPGLAIITSSQFRSATRSPSKWKPLSPTDNLMKPIKEEPPEIRRVVEDSQDPAGESLPRPTTFDSPSLYKNLVHPDLTTTEEFPSSAPPTESTSQEFPVEANGNSRNEPTKRERTVIYETDAESEYGDFEENVNGRSVTPSPKKTHREFGPQDGSQETQHSPESPKDDSQELPLPAVQSSPGLDDAPPSEAPMSDASICYQRMHAATQFPHEPIPTLNTQKMSELFPHGDSSQYTNLEAWKPSRRKQAPGPFSQTQTQSQEGDKESTEMVPESSPIRERERGIESGDNSFQRPRVPGSVVQVESSQAVDRDPQWQGRILSRSQLLTSSVMESIPLPNFWMGSQDSVGEPYSLPEG
ncbi:hypothetical protein N7536_009239 [Penicillium majusculum]|uniref:Uncharacterized protein n=1 Tax=Penicillium solitum TaxID=60172 RepID=A0A1V6R2Y3_9EURO|nr:uncharacterized protein PENSOL_c018G00530 [Penicillium solitum]KAJ5686620.1 hypothetical protein N7536_009239 [Penicillium majusculum]OQD95840.1 hypothetical protein PENSOL_c018G00530 [Penicillium solitum]